MSSRLMSLAPCYSPVHRKNAVLCDAAAEAVAREVEPGLFHRHSEETVWALGN